MKTVMRANRQLRIRDDQLENMLLIGYVEVDSKTGIPVEKPKSDFGEFLKEENTALKMDNEKLLKDVKMLTAKISEMEKIQKQ